MVKNQRNEEMGVDNKSLQLSPGTMLGKQVLLAEIELSLRRPGRRRN
jgi:hypothetical protein